jgi:hypothetical protein
MPTLDALLLRVLLPAGVAGVLLLCGRLPLLSRTCTSLALGAAYVGGHVGLRGWRGWVPHESTDRILAIVAVATVLARMGLTQRGPRVLRGLLHLGFGAGAAAYLAGAMFQREFGLQAAAVQVGLAGLAAALLWFALEREAPNAAATDARGGAFESFLLAIAAGGAAVAIGLSGSQLLAQLMGVFAAALAGAACAGRLLGAPSPLPRSAAPLALGHVALLLAATAFAELPREAAGPLALAPVFAPGAARGGRAARLVLLLAATGAGLWFAYDASPPFAGP